MKKNTIAGMSNAAAHIPCCAGPHIATQSISGFSHFMHSAAGITLGMIAPPVVTWAVNAAVGQFDKNKCDTGCNHGHHKKPNNPFTLNWWRDNKTSLLVGYGMQVIGFGADAMLHDHNDHEDHDHQDQTHMIEAVEDMTTTNLKKTAQYTNFNLT